MAVDASAAREGLAGKSAKAGKYLTFQMGSEVYGIEILKVQEIIGMMPVTHVPRTPDFVRGVINLRGKVIPVMELRRKFEMEASRIPSAPASWWSRFPGRAAP